MNIARKVADGILAAAPEGVPTIEASLPGLSQARPTRDGQWMIESLGMTASGEERRSGVKVTFAHGGAAAWSQDELGRAPNLVLTPGLLRRDFVGRHGALVELLTLAPTLPLLVRQIHAPASMARLPMTLTFRFPEAVARKPHAAVEVERSAGGVSMRCGDQVLAIALYPAVTDLEVVTSDAEQILVRATPGATDGTSSLVLSSGTEQEVRSALNAAGHLRGHALRAASGPARDGVALTTGVDDIDDAWSWLRSRLAGLIARSEAPPLLLGLAAQAVGDRDAAHQALSAFEAWTGAAARPAQEALLAAGQASVFGDLQRAAHIAQTWLSADDPAFDPDGLRGLAAEHLADSLQYGASPNALAALRRIGVDTPAGVDRDAPRGETEGRRAPRRLPVVGAPPSAPDAESLSGWLRGLLHGAPHEPVAPTPEAEATRLRHVAATFRSEPDRAWNEWRTALSAGIEGGPAGSGTWHPHTAAELLLALAHGMLGLRFDAAVGRLTLAPRLPSHLTSFSVRGITLGEITIRFDYERTGQRSVFTLIPETGGVPPQLIFEPSVPGEVVSVHIDGEPAELEARGAGRHRVLPVQLALDAVRVMDVVSAPA